VIPRELIKPIVLAAAPSLLAVLIAYLLGGTTAAFLVGLLLLPVAWFTLGFVGLATATSVVMLSLAGLVLAESVLERRGANIEQLRTADADVRQARRVAIMGSAAREENLKETIRRQGERLAAMSLRVERLERGTRELRSALKRARRRARARGRGK
jgi:hypothetical protein